MLLHGAESETDGRQNRHAAILMKNRLAVAVILMVGDQVCRDRPQINPSGSAVSIVMPAALRQPATSV